MREKIAGSENPELPHYAGQALADPLHEANVGVKAGGARGTLVSA